MNSFLKLVSSQFLAKVVGLFTTFLLINKLPVEDYGLYQFYLVTLTLSTAIINPVLSAYSRDFYAFSYSEYDFKFLTIPIIILPFLLYFFVISYDISLSLVLIFTSYILLQVNIISFTNVRKRFTASSIYSALDAIFILLGVFIYINFSQSSTEHVEEFLESVYTFPLGLSVIMLFYLVKTDKNIFSFSIDFKFSYNLIRDSRYLIFYLSSLPLINYISLWFIKSYLSETELGEFSFAMKMYAISLFFLPSIISILKTKQIDVVKSNCYRQYHERYFKIISALSVLFVILISIVFFYVKDEFFYEYRETYFYIFVLFISSGLSYILLPFSFLIPMRRYKDVFYISLITVITCLLFNWMFISEIGLWAPVLSTLISQFIINFSNYSLSNKIFSSENKSCN